MDNSLKEKVVYVVLSVAISLGGIYFFMIEPLNSRSRAGIKAHLESPKHGPFDEALAKSAGMEDLLKKKKPKRFLPESKPMTFPSDWSAQFPRIND